MKNVAASRPLALYLVLVFVGFWGCLALGYVDRLRFWVPILGALAPVSAALIVTGLGQGEPAARDLMRRLFSWRVRPAWYLAAIGIPVVQNLCAVGLAAIHGAFALSLAPWLKASISALTAVILVLACGPTLGGGRMTTRCT